MKSFNDINEVYDFLTKTPKEGKVENFIYNHKEYSYSLVSDLNISNFDKSILKGISSDDLNCLRQLKLYFKLNVSNPKVISATSAKSKFYLLIDYEKDGEIITIDYSNNIIMKKEDYYNLFKVQELNILSKPDLYKIFCILYSTNKTITDLFLKTSEEIDKIISKNRKLSFFNKKYDSRGINLNNYFMVGDRSDSIFFLSEDYDVPNESIRSEIEEFTLGHIKKCKHIYFSKEREKYVYKSSNHEYEFMTISDTIENEKLEKILTSSKRYYHCHENSLKLAYLLDYMGISNIYIVGGSRKINDVDSLYHSWVECGNLVYDFNSNLVIEKNTYYDLYQATSINKIHFKKVDELITLGVQMNYMYDLSFFINYFGDNLLKELKRNEFLIKK